MAIFAFAAMFGCTVQSPSTTPEEVQAKLELPATETAYLLTKNLTRRFASLYDGAQFDVRQRSFQTLTDQLALGGVDYFTASHAPARGDFWAAPLAVDGLAIIVNPLNPLGDLGLADLRDIFHGRLNDWRELDGTAEAIVPFSLPKGADGYLELARMLAGARGAASSARVVPGYRAMRAAVAEEPRALGYLPLGLIDQTVKALAIDGVAPTRDALREQRYPLRSTIYVIGREEPPPAFGNLIGWIQSDAGQAVVAETSAALP